MSDAPHGTDDPPETFVRVYNTFIEQDGDTWCLCSNIDGRRTVISRHASAEQARQAEYALNESANREPDEPPT